MASVISASKSCSVTSGWSLLRFMIRPVFPACSWWQMWHSRKTRAKYFIIFRRLTHNLKHKFSNFFSLYQKPWFNVLSCKQLVFTWITFSHPRSHEASDCMYREMNVDKDICCIRCKCHSGLIICTKCHLASDEHVKCRGEDFSQLLCNLLCMCDFN